jgi:hypothetical protein
MALLHRLNAQAGYDLMPRTIVPEGTALIPYGEERLRALRADVNALPRAAEALDSTMDAYALLDARDVIDTVANLRMSPHTGKIARKLDTGAWGIPRGFTGALEWLAPKARAEAFNDLATRADERVKDLDKRVFRTILNPNGERYLRAVTSQKHIGAKGNTARMCEAVKRVLQRLGLDDARVRVVMTHDRTEIEVFFPMFDREIKVGDVALGRQRIVTSETKDMSAQVTDGLLRVLCLNFTTAWYGRGNEFTRRHVGDGHNFLRGIASAMVDGLERLKPFVEAFGDANSNPFPASMPTRSEVLERAAKTFKGELPSGTWQASATLWDADGVSGTAGDTLAGLVNAMTRASQQMTLDDADAVERAAGRLVVEGWGALA